MAESSFSAASGSRAALQGVPKLADDRLLGRLEEQLQMLRAAQHDSAMRGFEARGDRRRGDVDEGIPQGLKPARVLGLCGTTEVVPFQNMAEIELFRSD